MKGREILPRTISEKLGRPTGLPQGDRSPLRSPLRESPLREATSETSLIRKSIVGRFPEKVGISSYALDALLLALGATSEQT